ncbi:MAG TPA: hypothetical protein VHZ54_10450 [Solirubrobacterales bacterium]|nr:hypothetical protein [Solirubrobacterales bacterium]
MSTEPHIDAATARVLATIEDDRLAGRYPDRAHFIAAENPDQGQIATRALFSGDPVVIVYPDGHELLIRPEEARGIAALFLLFAAFFTLRRSRRHAGDLIQLPPRAHLEARDASGLPIAA